MSKVHVIRVTPHPGCEEGLVRIDACDYDPAKHDLAYIEGEEPKSSPASPPDDPPAGGEGAVVTGETPADVPPADVPATEEGDASATSPKTTKKRKS